MDKVKREALAKLAEFDIFERPKDTRVYLVAPLVEAAYKAPQHIKEHHLETLKEFPKLVELVRYILANPKPGLQRFHVTPGPEATVDSLAEAVLNSFKELAEGRTTTIDEDLDI